MFGRPGGLSVSRNLHCSASGAAGGRQAGRRLEESPDLHFFHHRPFGSGPRFVLTVVRFFLLWTRPLAVTVMPRGFI